MTENEVSKGVTCAIAWELLSFSLRFPDDSLVEVVRSGEWTSAVEEMACALGLNATEAFVRSLSEVHTFARGEHGEILGALRVEATRLFVGTPTCVIVPYEGACRAAEDGISALMFVNPRSMEVERFCRACGLTHAGNANEPLDNISTECELLEWLKSLDCGLAELGESDCLPSDFPGGSPKAAYELFFSEHASAWMPGFASALAKETRLAFYEVVAMLLSALLRSEGCGR